VNGVGFGVGTRSRRRASQPRPGGFASRCLSRARFFALGEFGSRPDEARSAGGVGGSGAAFFLVTFSWPEQEKVTRRRAASGIIAVQASPEAIQQTPLTLALSHREREKTN